MKELFDLLLKFRLVEVHFEIHQLSVAFNREGMSTITVTAPDVTQLINELKTFPEAK